MSYELVPISELGEIVAGSHPIHQTRYIGAVIFLGLHLPI